MKYQIFNSSDKNVSKFVFEKDGDGVQKGIAVEAVLYRYNSYEERTVVCCSTQCGCPVGCSFCGTGKFFVRNLTANEIIEQVTTVLSTIDCDIAKVKKLQIMFMSMGEPFLNYKNVKKAITALAYIYPTAQLLISTSAPKAIKRSLFDFLHFSRSQPKVGLQFSVHESTDEARRKLIASDSLSLANIGFVGELWAQHTGRRPFFNYCVHEGNNRQEDVNNLLRNFNPDVWECTLSVICEKDKTMQNAINEKLDIIKDFSSKMRNAGYSLRVFNPAGQDDIGGGCGQLWYFQEWLKQQGGYEYGEKNRRGI